MRIGGHANTHCTGGGVGGLGFGVTLCGRGAAEFVGITDAEFGVSELSSASSRRNEAS